MIRHPAWGPFDFAEGHHPVERGCRQGAPRAARRLGRCATTECRRIGAAELNGWLVRVRTSAHFWISTRERNGNLACLPTSRVLGNKPKLGESYGWTE